MAAFLSKYQVNTLIVLGILCLFLALSISVIKFQSMAKKRALLEIELCTAVLAFSDAFAYVYRGGEDNTAYTTVRVVNFLVYVTTSLEIYFFNSYMTCLFMEKGKFRKLPVRLLLGFVLPSISITLVVISQFTGIFYTFDSNNNYVRGPLFPLSFVVPFAVLLIQLSFILQYRKMINRRMYISLLMFIILFVVAAGIQLFSYGLSLINLAICISAIALYIFALIDLNRRLLTAANTEAATGLPNTYGYLFEAEKIINYSDITLYNAYYFDIVRMSRLNNQYGKEIGDQIIYDYAWTIKSRLAKDEVLGRLGGNFFVALVKKEHTDEFLKLLEDVPVEVKTPAGSETVHLAAVAGAYRIRNKNIPAGQLIGYTATAVNYAKNVAKKPVVFLDDELEAELNRNKQLEEAIKTGFSEEEFLPFYQPKVDCDSDMLCGAEALVRWIHHGQLVSPCEFVPIMEKNSSICKLDFFMLEAVCKDLRKWLDEGANPVTVSVNISRRNLGNQNLAEDICKVVDRYEIPRNLIQIEVTETIDEYPASALREFVQSLRRYGFTVAVDDFGTGSSSLCTLKDITFDVLKIDKAFVDYKNEKEEQLLSYIIQMADALGTSVIAEGVEYKDQLAALKEMGCHRIQGFIYDKPLPHDQFEKRLRSKQYEMGKMAAE